MLSSPTDDCVKGELGVGVSIGGGMADIEGSKINSELLTRTEKSTDDEGASRRVIANEDALARDGEGISVSLAGSCVSLTRDGEGICVSLAGICVSLTSDGEGICVSLADRDGDSLAKDCIVVIIRVSSGCVDVGVNGVEMLVCNDVSSTPVD